MSAEHHNSKMLETGRAGAKERIETQNNNKVTIVKPDGRFTLLLGIHDRPEDPGVISQDTTAVMFEQATDNWSKADTKQIISDYFSTPQFSDLLPRLNDLQIPIHITDAHLREGILNGEAAMPVVEAVLGTAIGASTLMKFSFDHLTNNLSRRSFLKLSAGTIGSLWLGESLPNEILEKHADETNTRKAESYHNFEKHIHPERLLFDTLIINARNVLMAHKEEIILGENPNSNEVAMVVGAGHHGIQQALMQSPEERLAYLRSIKGLLKQSFIGSDFYSYGIVHPYSYTHLKTGEKPTIIECPELKEILK